MSGFFSPVLTESGRILKVSPDPNAEVWIIELVNGSWIQPSKPVSFDDLWSARVLTAAELRSYTEKINAQEMIP